jgi:hypothetical protein
MIGGTASRHKSETSDTQDTREIMHLLQHMDPEQRRKSIRLMSDLIHREKREGSSGG